MFHCISNGERRELNAAPGTNLLEALRTSGVYIPAVCAGKGVCGSCAVRYTVNAPPPSPRELETLGADNAANGFRLACLNTAEDGMEITCEQPRGADEQFSVLNGFERQSPLICDRFYGGTGNEPLGIAADIGTTTLAFQLVSLADGRRINAYSAVNRQRAFGADVISRIEHANKGGLSELNACITEDIRAGVKALTAGVPRGDVRRMAVAGNTTMLHILLNQSCESLGRYPFTPVFTGMKTLTFDGLFGGGLLDCPVIILPGVSAFVGADITAGIRFCGGADNERPRLLIDLGTNGEMALFSKGGVTVTSAAAGPAFEAGNIACGTGCVPGAVAKARYNKEYKQFDYETVGALPPLGLCGTGAVDVAAQLIEHGLADETGLFDDEYFNNGVAVADGVFFTQKDMREIQLAKSAARSGLEILLANADVGYDDVESVYLAGGFGFKIDVNSAKILGLLPAALIHKTAAVGNSALGGCARALCSGAEEENIGAIARAAREINLSADPKFNDLFMEHMMFVIN